MSFLVSFCFFFFLTLFIRERSLLCCFLVVAQESMHFIPFKLQGLTANRVMYEV